MSDFNKDNAYQAKGDDVFVRNSLLFTPLSIAYPPPFPCLFPRLLLSANLSSQPHQFDDGREIALLHYIYSRPNLDAEIRNKPTAVLAAIDSYARTDKYLMNVGDLKGKIVTDLIAKHKPSTMIELGGYIGYSTILFADAVRSAGGKAYFSFERNPEFAAVISSLVDLAGLGGFVKVIVGASDAGIKRAHDGGNGPLKHVDFMFLDHYKPAYTTDLKLCEELGLVGVGSVYAADNCITPGNPPYVEYVNCLLYTSPSPRD